MAFVSLYNLKMTGMIWHIPTFNFWLIMPTLSTKITSS
jgi:hypothetical protein